MEIYENLDLQDLDDEIWKVINGYEGYHISNLGRVKSYKYDKINGKILKQTKLKVGYFKVGLSKNGKEKLKKMHHLVYENFHENLDKNTEVIHHFDSNKGHNWLSNLQPMTKFDHKSYHSKGKNNINFGKRRSEESKKKQSEKMIGRLIGGNNPRSILKERDVIQIKMLYKLGFSTKYISEHFLHISKNNIKHIKNKDSWKHIKI